MLSVVKNAICKNFITINKREEHIYQKEMRWYSAEWCPCINCYQCEMCFSTRCQLTIKDSDRKTDVGRGFFSLFFTLLPSDYRTAGCLHSCSFFLLSSSFPLSPLVSTHSKSSCAMVAQLLLLRAYRTRVDCARYLMPVQVVTHSDRTERTTGRQRRRRPRPSCDWSAQVGKSGWQCFKWRSPSEKTHFGGVVVQYVSQSDGQLPS